MNKFKLQGIVTRHKVFGFNGGFGSQTSLRCPTEGRDGKLRESTIQVTIWNNDVQTISEGMEISVVGTLGNAQNKQTQLWSLQASGNEFKIQSGNLPVNDYQTLKPNYSASAIKPQPELSESDVPF